MNVVKSGTYLGKDGKEHRYEITEYTGSDGVNAFALWIDKTPTNSVSDAESSDSTISASMQSLAQLTSDNKVPTGSVSTGSSGPDHVLSPQNDTVKKVGAGAFLGQDRQMHMYDLLEENNKIYMVPRGSTSISSSWRSFDSVQKANDWVSQADKDNAGLASGNNGSGPDHVLPPQNDGTKSKKELGSDAATGAIVGTGGGGTGDSVHIPEPEPISHGDNGGGESGGHGGTDNPILKDQAPTSGFSPDTQGARENLAPKAYTGGADVVNTDYKQLPNGKWATITTTASGAVIEQVDGETPYTVKKAPTGPQIHGVGGAQDAVSARSDPQSNGPAPSSGMPPDTRDAQNNAHHSPPNGEGGIGAHIPPTEPPVGLGVSAGAGDGRLAGSGLTRKDESSGVPSPGVSGNWETVKPTADSIATAQRKSEDMFSVPTSTPHLPDTSPEGPVATTNPKSPPLDPGIKAAINSASSGGGSIWSNPINPESPIKPLPASTHLPPDIDPAIRAAMNSATTGGGSTPTPPAPPPAVDGALDVYKPGHFGL